MSGAGFADRLLAWHLHHGRHDLPWQQTPTPYRVWVSEIMLQQTQVATVKPYFERFMRRFPDLQALAVAPLDEILGLWSGLGYYARARNLHRAAQQACGLRDGRLPQQIDDLIALPGIGRSTAGAILALSGGQRQTILDGNVKRVLARHRGIEGWPGKPSVAARLWDWAERLTPQADVARYTQAMMDLGATLCQRRQPRCGICPVAADCQARLLGLTASLPQPRPPRGVPERSVCIALVSDGEQRVLLERRPPQGVWGGLWSLPEASDEAACRGWLAVQFGASLRDTQSLGEVRHTFTHFRLRITPLHARVEHHPSAILEGDRWLWYKGRAADCGLPAPVRRLIETVLERQEFDDDADGAMREAGP